MSYDAIVIGAGHHGLICAAFLAQSGWKVLVLEKQSEVGGALRTEQLTLPGFSHDLCATNVSGFLHSPAYLALKSEFDDLGLRFLTGRCGFATAYGEEGAQRVYTDVDSTENEIASSSKRDLTSWRELTSLYERVAPKFLPLYFQTMPSLGMARQLGRLIADPQAALRLAQILPQTTQQFADRHFYSPKIQGLFFPWALHADFGPHVRGGAMYAFMSVMSAYTKGLVIVSGGSGRISQALRTIVERRGGTVLTNHEVKQINVSNGKAVAVTVAKGGAFFADRAIISNVNSRVLFTRLVSADDIPAKFLERISRFRPGPATFIVHLALRKPLEWRSAPNLSEFSYVHVGGTSQECDEAYKQSLAGYIPAKPMMVVSQPTILDASRAPAGHHIVRIHARAFPFQILGDATHTIRTRDWNHAKEAVADRLVRLLANQAPNLNDVLIARWSVTPLDLEQDNPSLIHGDCVSGSHHFDQQFFLRPLLGWSRYQTPISGLYLTGASTWPGAGIHGASGYLAAQTILERARN